MECGEIKTFLAVLKQKRKKLIEGSLEKSGGGSGGGETEAWVEIPEAPLSGVRWVSTSPLLEVCLFFFLLHSTWTSPRS